MSGGRIVGRVLGAMALSLLLAPAASVEPDARAAGAAPAETGKATPTSYRLVDIVGIKGLLQQGRGHVVLLHFWASWCGPCMRELPIMEKFAHDMKPRGLEVLSISLDNPGRPGVAEHVGALLRKQAPDLTPNIAHLIDSDELIAAISPRWTGAIPALFVYDHTGQLRGDMYGDSTRPELEHLVGAWLKATDRSPAHPSPGAAAKPRAN
jgi:thiol-disulfide isomerase/thioredoxin